jgi:predicted transcriptional regulator
VKSSTQSLNSQRPSRALLSIKPEFVIAILDGQKRFEFRRSVFSRPVETVVVYATTPVAQVVLEFDVLSIISAPLPNLWRRTRTYAGLDKARFNKYFDGLEIGHAIAIGNVREYTNPFDLIEKFGVKPPQSFMYLDPSLVF